MKVVDRVNDNCDNCKHAYIMTDTMCFGCNHPTRRYSCMITVPSTCSDFEAGDPCYIGEDQAKDGCMLPHIQTNPEQTKQADTTTSPDWHFDGDTLKYHGERDKMYTRLDDYTRFDDITDDEAERSMSDDPLESVRPKGKKWYQKRAIDRNDNDKKAAAEAFFSDYYGSNKTPESVLQSCIELYKAKNKEYQNTDDQFENFTKGAELNQCSREQTLWGYCTKQIVSLASIIKTGKNREKISEKARDIIVYMAILEAMQ